MSIFAGCFRKMIRGSCKDEIKGYKVTDVGRTRKFGIACRNLQELKHKACIKFNISDDEVNVNIYLLDGSKIDDAYFETLETQTTLILQRPGEEVLSDADLLYNTLKRVNIDFITAGDAISKFLSENLKTKVAILNSALNSDDTKTLCSTREEHPEWFQRLETNVTTKEAYMHRRCQERIRGYLYKTVDQIKTSSTYLTNETAREHLLQTIAFFKLQLKEDHYFGFYFDRSHADQLNADVDETDQITRSCYDHCPCKLRHVLNGNDDGVLEEGKDEADARRSSSAVNNSPTKRSKHFTNDDNREINCPYEVIPGGTGKKTAICDRMGEFRCEGVWNAERCAYGERHRINPYRSREEFILFSTWNLDHKIERSRSLIPDLLKISEQDLISEKDVMYFYENLFTVKNLRLVHIICHDKGSHKQ